MILRREYLEKIKTFIDGPMIKVITGIRRSGKSYLLKQIIQEIKTTRASESQICFINKESLDFDDIQNYKDLNNYVKEFFAKGSSGKKYLFIDEIQDIHEWEKAIRSFFAEDDFDIYITGSNANLLASELATYLSGRYIEFSVYPLSFKEFLEFRGEHGSFEDEFKLYLRYGGFPALHLLPMNDEAIFPSLKAIYNTVVLKDIISRNKIRDVALLEKIILFIMDNQGSIFSANSIAKYLKSQQIKAGVDTIQNYLKYIEASFLLNKVRRYDLKGKRHFEMKEKYFLADHGIRNAILGFRETDISGTLENIVYLELLRRGYTVDIGELDAGEIDFVATKAEQKIYIQVCFQLNSQETIEREFKPLLKINDHYPKLIISSDQFFTAKDSHGVDRINIINFLLERTIVTWATEIPGCDTERH
ncbi:MAG: ATP-binding protein [Candidatus Melainabacteria bacterium]|nr:ATP-binding protein [Candidatus Melainabacteria bacterium]